MINEELWQTVLAQIQFSVSRANFATWFKNTKIFSKENGVVIISVENSFSKEWLSNKYSSLILKILRTLDKNIKTIEFFVEQEKNPLTKIQPRFRKEKIKTTQLPFQELVVDQETNLNPHYTFDNFIVGKFNEMSHALGWAVSENPDCAYNPLFIYGEVGLGKTHLLQAIGNRMNSLSLEKKIRYIPCERFVSGVVNAIQNHEIAEFKKKLRQIDILIIDDIQFFAGKEKSQEEFFHIFNIFYQAGKQIILSSDRPPKAIPAIEKRLMSRFEGGMITDIGVPDFETRIAILKEKCSEKNTQLKSDILEYIASNIRSNIREMEGALNRLIFFEKFHNKSPDIDTTKKLLSNLMNVPKKRTNFKKIIKAISDFYNLKEKEIFLETRKKEIVKPRQIAMYLLREDLKESFPSIGRKFEGKDHTTVIYAYKKVVQEIKKDDNFLSEINSIREKLYSGLK